MHIHTPWKVKPSHASRDASKFLPSALSSWSFRALGSPIAGAILLVDGSVYLADSPIAEIVQLGVASITDGDPACRRAPIADDMHLEEDATNEATRIPVGSPVEVAPLVKTPWLMLYKLDGKLILDVMQTAESSMPRWSRRGRS